MEATIEAAPHALKLDPLKHPRIAITIVALLVLGILPQLARAADVPTYAVLSLVGDRLGIVINEPSTGSHLDRNRREAPVAVTGDVFDGAVVAVAAQGIAKLVPGAQLAALNTRSPALFQDQEQHFRVTAGLVNWPEAIGAALSAQKATHLVLVTKHRAATRVEFLDSGTGSGSLEGLGFYVDGTTRLYDVDSGKRGQGFVAPYFYAKMSLIDVGSRRLIKSQTIAATAAVSSAQAEVATGGPWEALSPAEKVNAIRSLIQAEVARAVPLLFKAD